MVSGSDSHGTPITVSADKEGVSPRDIVERYHGKIASLAAAELAEATVEVERIESAMARALTYAHLRFTTDMAARICFG